MMAEPHLIGPPAVSTPADLKRSRGRGRDLPDDLLKAASRRLGIMSLLFAVLWVVGEVAGHLATYALFPQNPRWRQLDAGDAIATAAVIVSLALFAYTRKGQRDPKFVLDLGLAYMVFTAFALSQLFHLGGIPVSGTYLPEISWVGAVVLMFAAIVPSTPRKLLIAGLIAASMNPITMLVSRVRGVSHFEPWTKALLMHYPDFILVGAAAFISHVVTKLGQQVTKAREMGSYKLGELLGRGGMGEVYKATHRMLARPAAIKLIRTEMLGAVDEDAAKLAVTRFRREAEAAANLRSQHTVELYDFGVTEDGTLYLVMEFLDGMDLETLVRESGPLPAGRVIHVLRQVCESLEEAHASGFVHRDIKPANIHLGQVGLRHDFVKVLDFGLVKEVSSASLTTSMATIAGQMALGTPAYMAPEMALGEPVDGRADIYALGCVAYFLITGKLVFEAEKVFQMIAQHLQAAPIPPSERTDRPVSPELEQLIMKCLAKNPNDRPQSAADLAQLLDWIPADAWGEEQARGWWGDRKAAGQGPVQGAELVVPPTRSLSMQARLYSAALAAMLVLPGVLTAQANPVADAFRDNYRDASKNLIAAAEEFPADKLSFKPTPAQMSVGDIIVHLSQGNDYLCGSIGGVKAPTRDKVAADAGKAALIARLRETFAFCDQALAPLTDANLSEQLPFFGGRKMSRAAVMTITTGDWADHYSQYAIYLRLNGLLPPTAKKPAM
jgi:tRNA A-37 threonylcarbamoyl transferase component Bud32